MSIPAPFQQVWGTNGVMESSFPRQITVAACQVRPGSDVDENLELARRSVADAAARGAQIVVLPEATMVRFGVDPRPVAQPLDGPFAEGVRAVAREFGVLVVVGMFTPSDDGRVFNTVLATDGAAVEAHYDKVHLFDAYGTRESERTAPGREYVTFEALGTRMGLAACYDVRFADQFTAMGRAGAELVLLPTAWADGPRKTEQWELLVRARAMDAQAFVVGCDTAFTADVKLSFGVGHSLVAGPLGEVMGDVAGADPEVVLRTIDLAVAEKARAAVPILGADR